MDALAVYFKEVDLTALVTALGIALPAIIAAVKSFANSRKLDKAEKDRAVMKDQLEQNIVMTRNVHDAVNGNEHKQQIS